MEQLLPHLEQIVRAELASHSLLLHPCAGQELVDRIDSKILLLTYYGEGCCVSTQPLLVPVEIA
jgi:hypothetical protein